MKIAFHTLGCKVNQYESEALQEKFKSHGHQIVPETHCADVYIINTCTVTGLADRKSRQFIRRLRNQNPDCILAVIGCYAQMQPDEIASIEGVNIVAGTNEKSGLVEMVENYAKNQGVDIHRLAYEEITEFEEIGAPIVADSRTRAHIKVQDGCNRFCAYCIVPYARGNIRSRKLDNILEEAKGLIKAGYKEFVLTGINTALYGADQSIEPRSAATNSATGQGLVELIGELDSLPGDFRIRLSSLEPTVVDAATVKKLLQFKKLCPHFHLSLQSGSDRILAAMKRNYTGKSYLEIVDILRQHDPGFAVTTDIIVGFPGESEEDFQGSCDLVQAAGFAKVHVFKYSKRTGTAAAEMANQVAPAVKNHRSAKLQALEQHVGELFLSSQAGATHTLLIEVYDESSGLARGYTENYIHTSVPVSKEMAPRLLNTFQKVRLTGLHQDGMTGELLPSI